MDVHHIGRTTISVARILRAVCTGTLSAAVAATAGAVAGGCGAAGREHSFNRICILLNTAKKNVLKEIAFYILQ